MILIALLVLSKYRVIEGGIFVPGQNTPGNKQCMPGFVQHIAPLYEPSVWLSLWLWSEVKLSLILVGVGCFFKCVDFKFSYLI